MKKIISTKKIVLKDITINNIKPGSEEMVLKFVTMLIRFGEFETYNKCLSKYISKIAEDSSYWLLLEKNQLAAVEKFYKDEAKVKNFINLKETVELLKAELKQLPSHEAFLRLPVIDRFFIISYANCIYKKISYDEDILKRFTILDKIGQFDELKAEVKETVLQNFAHCIRVEGELFYGVKLRRSGINSPKCSLDGVELNNPRIFYTGWYYSLFEAKGNRKKRAEINTFHIIGILRSLTNFVILNGKPNENMNDRKLQKIERKKISSDDFVICCSIFQCMHKNHSLYDIEAVIEVMDIQENIIKELILPAGYCNECNRYFIFEDDFQKVKNIGIPLCRVIDEKVYRNSVSESLFSNGWSQESLLRQYGYSVSIEEGLTAERRQKILAVMIDIGVITRSEIKNYLSFFIRIRENNPVFELAISKWQEDLEFVSEYNKGHYTAYKVSGIRRGW